MMDLLTLSGLENAFGPLWAIIGLLVFAVLPTEVWRVLGVALGKGLDEQSEVFRLVRMISVALVTAVVAKLLLQPTGSIAGLSSLARFGSFFAGMAAFFLFQRSLAAGLSTGVALIILSSILEQ